MTTRKAALALPVRTPSYVSREVGAAELCISPETWDEWVRAGILPRPVPLGISGTTPRWRWEDVDAKLAGRVSAETQMAEPYFDLSRLKHGAAKERRRAVT